MITPSRRSLLLGLSGVLAAPALVQAGVIMPVHSFRPHHPSYGWEMVSEFCWRKRPVRLGDVSVDGRIGSLSIYDGERWRDFSREEINAKLKAGATFNFLLTSLTNGLT